MSTRIGLIGAGRMGKVFAHTLAFSISEADLTAVADPNEQTAAEALFYLGALAGQDPAAIEKRMRAILSRTD